VLRSVGEGQAGLGRQRLDALFALREVLQQVEAVGVAQAARDVGEGGEEIEFGGQDQAPNRA
jgi:hypothetical protein